MNTRTLTLLGALLLMTTIAYPQASKMKFGKVTKAEVEMSTYAADTSAAAVVLGDKGFTNFSYNTDDGFVFSFTRHTRIKILNKNGYDYADQKVSYYSPEGGGKDENVGGIKGYTYTMENGNLVKTKLDKSGIFEEQSSPNWKTIKFTLPNVKEGTVIEFKYTYTSPYVRNLPDWVFQYDIPLASSEYVVVIPQQLNYQVRQEGYVMLAKNDMTYRSESFSYSYWTQTRNGNEKFSGELASNSKVYEYIAENIPAFKEEPYMTSRYDYIGKMIFEVQSVHFQGQVPTVLSESWPKLSKNLLESSYFGVPIKSSGFLKKTTEEITLSAENDEQKAFAICNYLKQNVLYSGSNGIYTDNLKKAFTEKKASSQEINMMLIAMLRHAGMQADPVILSTRSHGFLREHFAALNQVNYVLCKAKIGDNVILLDATDPYLSNSLIPEKCLNGKGYVVSNESPGWVPLRPMVKKSVKLSGKVEIADGGEMTGNFKKSYNGYLARNKRKSILSKGEDMYKEDMIEKAPWELEEIEFSDLKEREKSLTITYDWESEDGVDAMGGTIYLAPMLDMKYTENIFKSEKRDYPVDFGCPEEELYYVQIIIPDGYTIAEKPENTAFALPNNGGMFTYQVSPTGNTVTIMSKLNINKALFVQMDYPSLRQFYANIVAKHAEQIVLKKT